MDVITDVETINDFIKCRCKKLTTDSSDWETLYINEDANEYWVKSYPNSECHGGGNPILSRITSLEVEQKFGSTERQK
ncbi:Imm27 family immunity protein [Thalassotalea nanhaiensis]|uniref:Imm27 family immunity protein n=1 Tax=Thalassotalea nanhaiensis TaxID=3065648 RepID=A0ABY9TJR9_9GAMM|nr:Imm27 family immunity protein [Colwelliaceae bacterium SQ345]